MKYREIIEKLSIEEKAALMSGRDFWSTTEYAEKGVPSIFLADGPHGIRKQAAASDHLGLNASIPATCFPTAATMANAVVEGRQGEENTEAPAAETAEAPAAE